MTDNFIEVFPKALDDESCDLGVEMTDWAIENNQCELVENSTRKDYNIFIHEAEIYKPFKFKILDCLYKYEEILYRKYRDGFSEDHLDPNIKLQKSESGGGFYGWHTEQGPSKSTRARFMVWMIYLNTVTKGGRTEFKYQDISLQPTKGTLVIWPAAYTHVHRSSPDLEEDKYIATGWFNYNY